MELKTHRGSLGGVKDFRIMQVEFQELIFYYIYI